MKRAGIIGHPVAHSLSPILQGAAFKECGLDVSYELWDTTAEALAGRLVSLRAPEYLGANVTIPHKEAVLTLVDELGGQSARAGAVNTIVNREGRLFGFNTDGPGFVAALRTESGFDPAGRSVVLVGAGGAARGIAFALAEARAARITIVNRTAARAERLAHEIEAAGVEARACRDPRDAGAYDCVVNCTSVGMHGGPNPLALPFEIATVPPAALVADIVYAPAETPLLTAARAAGLKTLEGLPMLVYQGALAFEHWTGLHAPIDAMFTAARLALAERREATARTAR